MNKRCQIVNPISENELKRCSNGKMNGWVSGQNGSGQDKEIAWMGRVGSGRAEIFLSNKFSFSRNHNSRINKL